ncbi:MAG: hypothetical protein QXX08_11140 [Candidatus Bathyarchaeia archaeon]
MFSHIIRGRKGEPVIIDAYIDHAVYDKFVAYREKKGLSEGDALVGILERGMANYRLQEFKHMKQDYTHIEKLFTEYKKDNETFKALLRQNEQLRKILEEKKQKTRICQTKNHVVKT